MLSATYRQSFRILPSVAKSDPENLWLALMNDPIFSETASAFAKRLLNEVKTDGRERLERAFRLALGRSPKEEEKQRFPNYLDQQGKDLEQRRPSRQANRGCPGTCSADLGLQRIVKSRRNHYPPMTTPSFLDSLERLLNSAIT
jgi:hypothetical protein